MKQNLRLIFMTLLCAVFSTAWGQTSAMIEFGNAPKVAINNQSVTGVDDLGNTWTITTEGTTSFTSNSDYYQVGSGNKPASRITFTTTLSNSVTVTELKAKFGGFSGTAGTVTLKVGDTTVGSGSLNGTNDVIVSSGTSAQGTVLTVTVTGISKGVKCYKIEYTYTDEENPRPNAPVITADNDNLVTIEYDDGLAVYYTIDGTTPTNESTLYTEPFTPESSCTVKAIAYDADDNASDISELSILIHINSNFYVKVTDASTLQNGDAILIVHEDEEAPKALGTQNTNNRAAAAVTITNHIIQGPFANVQKLILVGTAGAWYFYDNQRGYLYAASSSSNHLKTQNEADDNAKATINISGGDATIVFQGSYTHNILRYNSGSNLFSCYTSGQAPVQIYKEVPTIPVEISSVGYATLFYGEKHLIVPSGVEAYTCNVNEDKTIEHTTTFETGDVIPAGTAVLLHGAAGTYSFGVSGNPDNVTVGANMLRGHDVATETSGPDANTQYKFFTLSLNAAGEASSVGFYYMNAGGAAFTSEAHKAYLAVPTSIAGASSYIFDENTGIKSMEAEKQCQEGVYTLSGVRMRSEQLPAGIYIVNGKKMVIK